MVAIEAASMKAGLNCWGGSTCGPGSSRGMQQGRPHHIQLTTADSVKVPTGMGEVLQQQPWWKQGTSWMAGLSPHRMLEDST